MKASRSIFWGLRPGDYVVEVEDGGGNESEHVFRSLKVKLGESGDVRADIREVATGTDVVIDARRSGGSSAVGGAMLVPGQVRAPTDAASAERLAPGVDGSYENGKHVFRRVPPGLYTLLLFSREQGERVGVFSQSVDVMETPSRQVVRVTVPDHLPALRCRERSSVE